MRTIGISFTLLIAVLLSLAGGYVLRGCTGTQGEDRTTVQADTVFVDRLLVERDTIRVSVPERVTIYRTVTDLRIDTIRVPANLGEYRVTTPRPLHVTSRRVMLTAFDPSTSRWEQQSYAVPERRFSAGLTVGGGYLPLASAPYVSVGASARYRRLSLATGIMATPGRSGAVRILPRVGLTYSLIRL